jgi:hypothetical protein
MHNTFDRIGRQKWTGIVIERTAGCLHGFEG